MKRSREQSECCTDRTQSRAEEERAEATAADWLALRAVRPLNPEEQRAFANWRAADPTHERIAAELESAWQALDRLADYPRPAGAEPDPDRLSPAVARGAAGRMPSAAWMRAGAAAALLAAALTLAFVDFRSTIGPSTHPDARQAADGGRTGDGDRAPTRLIRLQDGTVAELRADGALIEEYDATQRRVRLLRGEAFFTVRRDPARPFIVDTGGVTVRAVGTAFNVRVGSDSVVVLVTEGVVRLNPLAELGAGQRTVVPVAGPDGLPPATPTAPVVESVSQREIEAALAWKGGPLVFNGTPLAQAVAEFNRRNVRQLVIASPGISAMRIGGRFRAENIDGFVELLESSFGLRVSRRGDEVLLHGEP